MRRHLYAALGAALVLGLLAPGAPAKPRTVWEDPEGDAFLGAEEAAPLFAAAGFDIVSGSLEAKDGNLEFTVTHASMPPFGNMPEAVRFLWAFSVDGEHYRITVKRADIGKPDVIAGQSTERVGRADVDGHFRLEGNCTSEQVENVSAINCEPLGYFEGTYDVESNAFVFPVPLEAIGARPGSRIGAGGGDAVAICSICWVSHVAERSSDATVIDTAAQEKTYKVPGGKKKPRRR